MDPISLCQRNPGLTSTILDFPNVIAIAETFVGEADMAGRIGFLPGNPWRRSGRAAKTWC